MGTVGEESDIKHWMWHSGMVASTTRLLPVDLVNDCCWLKPSTSTAHTTYVITIKMLSARPFSSGALAQRSGQLTRKAVVVVKCVAQPSHRAAAATSKQQSEGASGPASLLAAGALLAPLVVDVQASLAAGGEYGLLEGRCEAVGVVWHAP